MWTTSSREGCASVSLRAGFHSEVPFIDGKNFRQNNNWTRLLILVNINRESSPYEPVQNFEDFVALLLFARSGNQAKEQEHMVSYPHKKATASKIFSFSSAPKLRRYCHNFGHSYHTSGQFTTTDLSII